MRPTSAPPITAGISRRPAVAAADPRAEGERRPGQPVHGSGPGHHRHRRDGRGGPHRALYRAVRRRSPPPRRPLIRRYARPPRLRPRRASGSTPATTSISTTCRLSARRSRSSPRSASATRSPPTRCASAFPPRSRPQGRSRPGQDLGTSVRLRDRATARRSKRRWPGEFAERRFERACCSGDASR